MKLHASGEDYLETILVLQKKLGMVRSVDVARHMEVSKPSVCHAAATLRDGGFLRYLSYRYCMVHHRSIGCSAYKIFWIQGVPSRENHPLARWYCYDFLLDSSQS